MAPSALTAPNRRSVEGVGGMEEFLFGASSALWLGLLTSLSPCPLATNIAAISYVSRRVDSTRQVLFAGLLYTLGCMLAYLGLALVLVNTALSVPRVSLFLQKYTHLWLGPILVIIGMFLIGLLPLNLGGGGVSERLQHRVDTMGIWGALLLGFVFALSFCPTSAALFFGNVMNSLESGSTVAIPLMYGVGTAVPVVVFAALIAISTRAVGRAFDALSRFSWWARTATGNVFIVIGIYFCLRYIFEIV